MSFINKLPLSVARALVWPVILILVQTAEGKDLDTLRAEAESGDPQAVTALARALYDEGDAASRNLEEAFELFKEVARESPDAAYFLGRMYARGEGTATDTRDAVRWWKRAARDGQPRAANDLAYFHEKGIEVRQDYEDALEYYRQAARLGHVPAMARLGFLNEAGLGKNPDLVQAIDWYEQAAGQGYPPSIVDLGRIYWTGRHDKEAEPAYDRAVAYFKKGTELDNALSQHHLGLAYRDGKGVEADTEKALRYFNQAAEQELPAAANVLGTIYLEGRHGVTVDKRKALEYYRIASQDVAFAANLKEAVFLLELEFGDAAKVIAEVERAATEDRDFDSALLLNRIYSEGLGLPRDPEKARKWGLLVDEIIMEQIGM
ncbi:MAG: SEL1-like repeat protein [Opitutales bacterium]